MLKTNNKEVKEAVKAYVWDWLEGQSNDWNASDRKDLVKCLESDIAASCSAMESNPYAKIDTWLDGGNIEAYIEPCRNLLKEWLKETEEEANSFNDGKVWKLWKRLTTKAIIEILKG